MSKKTTDSKWYKSSDKETFDGVKTIKNYISKELEINSKNGFIWEYNSTHYMACITNHRIINRHCNPIEAYKAGEEKVIKFPKSDLKKWMTILKIKQSRPKMIERANSF